MSELLKNVPFTEENDYKQYEINDLKSLPSKLEMLDRTDVIVLYTIEEHWMTFCFLAWSASSGDESWYTPLWHGMGPTGSLRECRHSYIGEDGYVFYVKKQDFIAVLDWLSQHYDMD
jgi:hypothetical protein